MTKRKVKPKPIKLTPEGLASRKLAHELKVIKFLAGGK